MTPEEVYQFISNRECDFYPDKCKETHYWNCPDCGHYVTANCAIVKINHEENSGWRCEGCQEFHDYVDTNKMLGNQPTWDALEAYVADYQTRLRNCRVEKSQTVMAQDAYLVYLVDKYESTKLVAEGI